MQSPPLRRVNVVVKHQSPKFINLSPRRSAAVARPPTPAMNVSPTLRPYMPVMSQKKLTVLRAARNVMGQMNKNMIEASSASVQRIKGVGKDRFLIIVGNGPSTNEAPLEKLKGVEPIDIMSINKPEVRLWPTKWWAICDQSQYMRHPQYWAERAVCVITSSAVRAKRDNQVSIRCRPGKGFSRSLADGFHIGRSTCYASMQTALWMNYDKIFIFGCDMTAVNGIMWSYQPTMGANPDVDAKSREKRFQYEAQSYQFAADNLNADEKNKFTFCSSHNPWSFMQFFQRLDQKTAVDEILKLAETKRKTVNILG
ncbi:MAG: hypothetical protein Q8K86_07265 [Candidatus Nanopelagicaceae bacterium]|nr:hypothetical protein [Candidatus Nanopelagicaceae bacterium]